VPRVATLLHQEAMMAGSEMAAGRVLHILARNWWAVALRGAVAVIFGILAVALPGIAIFWLAVLFGAYMLIDGVFAIVAGVRAAQHHARWWPFALEGVADIAAGLIVVAFPSIIVILVAIWAIVTGVLMISAGFSPGRPHGAWMLVLSGLLSVLLGIVFIGWPGAGVVAIGWWIGAYAIAFGIVLLVFAFRLRRHLHYA
jgi:uncharacterized membrane protein HdeD (DUF308 family)